LAIKGFATILTETGGFENASMPPLRKTKAAAKGALPPQQKPLKGADQGFDEP
jgi:hypothetical protein